MTTEIKNDVHQFVLKDILFSVKQWMFLKNRYNLTNKELQVVILICRGYNNNEIGKRLNIKLGTVKTHIKNIYIRTGTKNKMLLLLKFMEDIREYFPHDKD